MSSHYDRETDIAWLTLDGFDGQLAFGEGHPWGVIERDRESDRIVGVEFWHASERLPQELLAALPAPRSTGAVVESADVAKHQAA